MTLKDAIEGNENIIKDVITDDEELNAFLFYDLKVFYVCSDCRKKLGVDKNIHGYTNRMD